MGKGRRRHRDAPHVQPLDVDGVRTVAILTVLWAVAFVVLTLNRARLDQVGNGWLLWTCLAGVGLGLLGLEYTRKRRDAIAEALLEAEAEVEEPDAQARADEVPEDVPTAAEAPHAATLQDRTSTRPLPFSGRPSAGQDQASPPDQHPGEAGPDSTNRGRAAEPPSRFDQGLASLAAPVAPRVQPADPFRTPSTGSTPLPPAGPFGSPASALPTQPIRPATATEGTPSNPATPATPGTPATPASPGNASTPEAPATAAEPAAPVHPTRPAGRRRRPAPGPVRPGQVDVADVDDLPAASDAAASSQPAGDPGPTWSELIDVSGATPPPAGHPSDPDEPLLDDTTLGRRAKRYDMTEEINEITQGGGDGYRGRRARRSDSA